MRSLILLHGAIGSATQLHPLAELLKPYYKVYTPGFTGHGGLPGTDQPFSIELFAADVLRFIEQEGIGQVSVFGYSMGGYIGMYLARHHPEKVDKLVTLATKYLWDGAIAAREVQMLEPAKIEQKIPAFAESLRTMHLPGDWKQLLHKTAAMMTALGNDSPLKPADYPLISTQAMLLLGDRDKMVSLDETLAVYKALPNACMGMLPATPHSLEQSNINALAGLLKDFLDR